MIRLVLVDDQAGVRREMRKRLALEPDLEVVGEAGNGRDAVARANELLPDIVLMDVEMPEMDGITAATVLRGTAPQSAVIILSIHDDGATLGRANAAGAAAFIPKSGDIEILIATIRRVAEQRKM